MYVNISLINWYWKKQSNIKTSVLCAAFVAMKVGVDKLHAIWYKLRMMDIPTLRSTYIYEDCILIIHNTLNQSQYLWSVMELLIMLSANLWQWENIYKIRRKSSWFANKCEHWAKEEESCVISVIWHIWWGCLTIGENNIPSWKTCFMAE